MMRTDELADMLARGAAAEHLPHPTRAWAVAGLGGLAAATAALLFVLGLHPHLVALMTTVGWWIKTLFSVAVAVAGLYAATRLGRPGANTRRAIVLILVPFAVIAALAAGQLALAPVAQWDELVVGQTWLKCVIVVAGLSLPTFVLSIRAFRALAPTRPRLAGAVAGLCGGGVGASVYALHCPEIAPAFVAVWYVLGIAFPTVCGALIGSRVLRW